MEHLSQRVACFPSRCVHAGKLLTAGGALLCWIVALRCGVIDPNQDIRFHPVYLEIADTTGSIDVETDTTTIELSVTGIGKVVVTTDSTDTTDSYFLPESLFVDSVEHIFDSAKYRADGNAMLHIINTFPKFYTEELDSEHVSRCLDNSLGFRDRTTIMNKDTVRNRWDSTRILVTVTTAASLTKNDLADVIHCCDSLQ